MKISIAGLRAFLPDLPHDLDVVRAALDSSGLEVKGVETGGTDTWVTLELLANRGDHRCYQGVAVELAARLRLPHSGLPIAPLDVERETGRVVVGSTACLAYTLTRLTVLEGSAPLTGDVVARLAAGGGLTGHPVVDAANAAALEYGRPVHVFDADRVSGTVCVRLSRAGEEALLLGEKRARALPGELLVVADEEKILAVAGVLGCETSRVVAGTRRVLLESAAYDPVTVRKAASALGLSTAASQLFERGVDPGAVIAGAGRVVHLLESSGIARREALTFAPVLWERPAPVIELDARECAAFLGMRLDLTEIAERLASYGFRHNGEGRFVVPGTRIWDVREPEDLYEEVARHVGYDAIPASPLPTGVGAPLTLREQLVEEVGDTLVGLGFYETFTEGFYGRDTLALLSPGETDELARHVRILNAEDRRYSMLKNNCLAQAVSAVDANLRFKQADVRLFEATRVFEPDSGAPNGLCRERGVIWAVATGNLIPDQWAGTPRMADVHFVRGVVEEIAARRRTDVAFRAPSAGHPLAAFLHPYRSAEIIRAGRSAGILGEVHPDVRRRAGLGGVRPCYLELDLDAWEAEGDQLDGGPFREDPPVDRMLDFVLPSGVLSQDIAETMTAAAPPWLRDIRACDVFIPGDAEPGERSVTFVITFDSEPARPAEEFNASLRDFVEAVTDRFGDHGVRLR